MEIQTVAVIGAGQMGGGIAQVAAQSGLAVLLADTNLELAARGLAQIGKRLERLAEKGKLPAAEAESIARRIRPVAAIPELAAADFAIEAVAEKEEIKVAVFRALDSALRPEAILASNTSSIPITRIAAATRRPDRVIGMHFMNPVPLMTFVEVIRALQTSDSTYEQCVALARRLGKETAAARDMPGFAVNRLLCPMLNEACFALAEGLGTVADIDKAMKLGCNHPMGPFELADFVGLDTLLSIMEVLHRGLGDDKYRPAPLLRQYVDAGWLGRKSGRGFYTY